MDGMMEPEVLAESVVTTMDKEEFLILPHPEVLSYLQRKAGDYDRWLGGMQRLKQNLTERSSNRSVFPGLVRMRSPRALGLWLTTLRR